MCVCTPHSVDALPQGQVSGHDQLNRFYGGRTGQRIPFFLFIIEVFGSQTADKYVKKLIFEESYSYRKRNMIGSLVSGLLFQCQSQDVSLTHSKVQDFSSELFLRSPPFSVEYCMNCAALPIITSGFVARPFACQERRKENGFQRSTTERSRDETLYQEKYLEREMGDDISQRRFSNRLAAGAILTLLQLVLKFTVYVTR